MRTIILNSSNVVDNGFNDTYEYKFPTGAVNFKDDQICVESISMYFSWFNITSATTSSQYNNNSFSFVWYDAGGPTTYNVVLPDGYYEVSDLNAYIQFFCVSNGLYLIDATGNYVYYLELVLNPQYYAVQLNCYPIPTALPALWTNPGGITFPAVASTPLLIISPTNNFGKVIGFNAGTYPAVTQSFTYSVLSQNAPQVSPVTSLVMTCSLLNNNFAVPNTLLYAFSPIATTFGGLINILPQQAAFTDIYDGSYNFLRIQFFDQNLNRIYINDPNVVLLFIIGRKERYLVQ